MPQIPDDRLKKFTIKNIRTLEKAKRSVGDGGCTTVAGEEPGKPPC